MSAMSAAELLFLPKVYDWSQFKTLVDVGGSLGVTLGAIKAKHKGVKCINFDLPEVVAAAPPVEGVEHVGGDVFDPATIPQVSPSSWPRRINPSCCPAWRLFAIDHPP
jgi:hypothetical protein